MTCRIQFYNNTKDWEDMIGDAGVLPGDFRNRLIRTWMRYDTTSTIGAYFSSSTYDVKTNGELKTLLRSFWDCIWTWKHEGSMGVPEWDKRLTSFCWKSRLLFNP